MPTENEINERIIREIARLVARSEDPVELRKTERPAGTYWTVRATANDTPKLVGTGGAHVRAMQHLVRGFQDSAGLGHNFRLLDPDPGPVSPRSKPQPNAAYSPDDLVELLEDLLEALGVSEYQVSSKSLGLSADGSAEHEIEVNVRTVEDYELLTVPQKGATTTHVAEIGLLFRAAAAIGGGRVNVQIKRL